MKLDTGIIEFSFKLNNLVYKKGIRQYSTEHVQQIGILLLRKVFDLC